MFIHPASLMSSFHGLTLVQWLPMSQAQHRTNYLLVGGVVAPAIGIFILDLHLPLGAAIGVLYAVPVVVSLWFPRRRYTMLAALAGTILTILDVFLSFAESPLWIVFINRAVSLVVIWATAILVLLYKQAQAEMRVLHGLLPICASCKKIRDERQEWNYLEEYIESHSEAQFTHGLCSECMEQYYGELLPSAAK
jgi:hypothetical protein